MTCVHKYKMNTSSWLFNMIKKSPQKTIMACWMFAKKITFLKLFLQSFPTRILLKLRTVTANSLKVQIISQQHENDYWQHCYCYLGVTSKESLIFTQKTQLGLSYQLLFSNNNFFSNFKSVKVWKCYVQDTNQYLFNNLQIVKYKFQLEEKNLCDSKFSLYRFCFSQNFF